MENIIYNELVIRGYNVDVGVVEKWEKDENSKSILKNLEVDFICNLNDKKYYIQSVYSIDDEEKKNKELKSLNSINDSFKKIIILKDNFKPWIDDKGVYYISLKDFLTNEDIIEK